MIVEVHIHNHTPPDWGAVITGAAADFLHRDGSKSQDNKPSLNIPSGKGEAVLYSANVDCVKSFTVHIAVRDRSDRVQIISRSFKDPHNRPCVEAGQDCNLGSANLLSEAQRLGVSSEVQIFDIGNEIRTITEWAEFAPPIKAGSTEFAALAVQRAETFVLDYPIVLPPYTAWSPWPGVDPSTPIPANAMPVISDSVWEFPAPRSQGAIGNTLNGTNVKIWRFVGVARNGYGSPGRPDGPWGACLGLSECPIGWAQFFAPTFRALNPGVFYAELSFRQWSSDYPRFAYWYALASPD